MEITLKFSKTEIIQLFKSITHKRGAAELAADGDKAVKVAYNEQAGESETDNFIIMSALRTALDTLKSYLSDYIISSGSTVADNISDTLSSDTDLFVLLLSVSDRFNKSMTQPLADICSSFIRNQMLLDWYVTVSPNSAKNYSDLVEVNKTDIAKCFIKVSPSAPSHNFPTAITVTSPAVQYVQYTTTGTVKSIFSPIDIINATQIVAANEKAIEDAETAAGTGSTTSGTSSTTSGTSSTTSASASLATSLVTNSMVIGADSELAYTLPKDSDGNAPIDDVRIVSSSNAVQIYTEGGSYHVSALHVGAAVVTLYSQHRPSVYTQFLVNVEVAS